MSIPLRCQTCQDIIGTSARRFNVAVSCLGVGNHAEPKRTEKTRFFGLLKTVCLDYPETSTRSLWQEYSGSKQKFWLWFAIVFGTREKRVIVNGKGAWFDWKIGLFGDGVEELRKVV